MSQKPAKDRGPRPSPSAVAYGFLSPIHIAPLGGGTPWEGKLKVPKPHWQRELAYKTFFQVKVSGWALLQPTSRQGTSDNLIIYFHISLLVQSLSGMSPMTSLPLKTLLGAIAPDSIPPSIFQAHNKQAIGGGFFKPFYILKKNLPIWLPWEMNSVIFWKQWF